jgi:hypothetical protein
MHLCGINNWLFMSQSQQLLNAEQTAAAVTTQEHVDAVACAAGCTAAAQRPLQGSSFIIFMMRCAAWCVENKHCPHKLRHMKQRAA